MVRGRPLIARSAQPRVEALLRQFPAVARQRGRTAVYLDLETPSDRAWLADVEHYLSTLEGSLVILDEIHRVPGLFQVLRGLIDRGRARGRRAGRFLLLGSAAIDLLRQSSETLRRFWTMLAHEQGQTINHARIAAGLAVSGQTVTRYLDLLTDLLGAPARRRAGARDRDQALACAQFLQGL